MDFSQKVRDYVPKPKTNRDAPHELGFSVEGNEYRTKPYAGPLSMNINEGFGRRTQNAQDEMKIKSKGKFKYGDQIVVGRKSYTFGPKDNIGGILSGYSGNENFVQQNAKVLEEYPEPAKQTRQKWKTSKAINVPLEKPDQKGQFFTSKNNKYMERIKGAADGHERTFENYNRSVWN